MSAPFPPVSVTLPLVLRADQFVRLLLSHAWKEVVCIADIRRDGLADGIIGLHGSSYQQLAKAPPQELETTPPKVAP